jgi:hypothetical protein
MPDDVARLPTTIEIKAEGRFLCAEFRQAQEIGINE